PDARWREGVHGLEGMRGSLPEPSLYRPSRRAWMRDREGRTDALHRLGRGLAGLRRRVQRVAPGAAAGTPLATPTFAGATAAAGTTVGEGDAATRVVIIDRHLVTCSVSAGRSAAPSETFRVACTSNGSSTRSEGDISW